MGQLPDCSLTRPIPKPEGAGAKIRGSTHAGGREAWGQGANPAQDGGGTGSGGAEEAVRIAEPGSILGRPQIPQAPCL